MVGLNSLDFNILGLNLMGFFSLLLSSLIYFVVEFILKFSFLFIYVFLRLINR